MPISNASLRAQNPLSANEPTAETTSRRQLNHAERLAWLRLARTENVGPITFRQLLTRYGSAEDALDALPELAQRGGRKTFKACSIENATRELDALEEFGARLIAMCEPDYPALLAAVEDAPPVMAVRGHPHIMAQRCVAIVGARNASLNGRKFAEQIARELGGAGLTVISGLARGIDTAAHQGSLPTGTVAVLAGGVDNVYPQENLELYEKIAEAGCIVAEMPFGSEPRAQHFPRRNRIISGISLGVVVIEAAKQSGSLITAQRAADQGREVFAVPGSPLDPRCGGTNNLLRNGAVLIEGVADILDQLPTASRLMTEPDLPLFAQAFADAPESELRHLRDQVLENLGPSPVSVDELIRQCHVSPPLVLTVLLELELAGRVQRLPGNQVVLVI